jgi:hypothetical protein
VTFFCEAHLEGMDVSHANVRLADLSVDGAFVDARTVLPPGALARLRFTILEEEVTVQTEVRYSMPGMGMGLRFVDLAPEARNLITRFVEGQP